jgi:hypothetical protein
MHLPYPPRTVSWTSAVPPVPIYIFKKLPERFQYTSKDGNEYLDVLLSEAHGLLSVLINTVWMWTCD